MNAEAISQKQILLVDDDLDDRELFVEALNIIQAKPNVQTLDNSEHLVSCLSQMPTLPDFLFLDLNMPRKNGKECLKEIQNNEHLKNIRIVIYSTSINPKDVVETYQHGAYCFIQKPNSFADLKAVLKKVIESSSPYFNLENGFVFSGENFRFPEGAID
jgi:DNA-binding NtrC family response regulator